MKIENIPADIKSKSIKETREEINTILTKLENQETNLDHSIGDYQRLILLEQTISINCLRRSLKKFTRKKSIKRRNKLNNRSKRNSWHP